MSRTNFISLVAAIAIAMVAVPAGAQTGQQGMTKQTWGVILGGIGGAIIGDRFGRGHADQTAAALLGGVLGALAGSAVGKKLDENDLLRAQQAQYDALEFNRSGSTTSWNNPDSGHSGSVTPVRTWEQDGTYCREFQEQITIDGQAHRGYGTACRQSDGSWKIAG